MEERILSLNGHDTRVMMQGTKGPALMFLHGFPEYAGAWGEVFAEMGGFRCFAPDQRGYGISYRPEGIAEYAIGKLARDMLDLIGVLDLERVHLIGHDWGASVAYACAFANDPRIASLTILNGVHPIPYQRAIATGGAQCRAAQYIPWLKAAGSEDVLAANGFERLIGMFSANMDMSWLSGGRLDAYKAAWGDAEGVGAMINWYRASPLVVGKPGEPLPADDVPDWPAERMVVRVPHLLLWGAGDTALLPEAFEGLEDHCTAGLEITHIDGTDHWLHHQRPHEVAERVRAFVERIDVP